MNWSDRRVLVTGGASFVGSALVDVLVRRGARVRVVDDLSDGCLDNLRDHLAAASIEFVEGDLLRPDLAREVVEDVDVAFHLASDHDGCAYGHPHAAHGEPAVARDGIVFRACAHARVERVVFASSGAPGRLGPRLTPCDRARRSAEMTLRAYASGRQLKTASCRYFAVYGERGPDWHPVTRLVADVLAQHDPFVVPAGGDGRWTYVGDVAEGLLLAAASIDDGSTVNLETIEQVRLADAVRALLDYTGHDADIHLCSDSDLAPITDVAERSAARWRLGWTPKVTFAEGLHRTIDWYVSTRWRGSTHECFSSLRVEPA